MKKIKTKSHLLKTKRIKLKVSNKDSYATQGMLLAVRDELKSDIVSLDLKIEARMKGFESKLTSFESKMSSFDAKMSRMLGLMEEQRAENRTVWDQQNAIIYKQEKLEDRLSIVEETSLLQAKSK